MSEAESHARLFASTVPGNGSASTLGSNGAQPGDRQPPNTSREVRDEQHGGSPTPREAGHNQWDHTNPTPEVRHDRILGANHPGFNPHQVTMRTPMEMSYPEMKNGVLKMNASSTWTTLLKPSDERRSQNSKRFPKSYQSSILTHRDLKKGRTLPSNFMPEPSTKLRPLLLQWLGGGTMLPLDYNPIQNETTFDNPPEMLMPTMQSRNLYPKSVENQTNLLNEISPQGILTQTMISMNPQIRNGEFLNQKCLGLIVKTKQGEMETRIVRNPIDSYNSSLVITRSSNNGFKTHKQHHSDSPILNGTTSSRDKPSTSTPCSPHCTIYLLLKRTLDAWDQLRYPLVDPSLPRGSKRAANGQAPGTPLSKQLNLLSRTGNMNSENMGNILKAISLQKSHPLTEKSSFMTVQSEMKSAEHKTPYSRTPTDSPDSIQQSSCPMELNLTMLGPAPSGQLTKLPKLKYVTTSTPPMAVETQQTIAASNMPASGASAWAMERNIAIAKRDLAREIHPKYLRYNIWNEGKH